MTLAAASALPEASATVRRIADFLRGFSIEATRPTAAEFAALNAVQPRPSCIYLAAIPTRPLAELVEYAAATRVAGFEPVPHLAVRNLPSRTAFDDLLSRLAGEAGVKRALVIAGDADRAQGPYASALDAIESGLLQHHGIVEIGIAGHPEGHPRVSVEVLDRALAAKIDAAGQTGLDVHIVTQFGFSAAAIESWILRVRDLGIEVPIRIGMAGPTSLATLLRYAKRCGVMASAQGLTRQGGLIKHLVGTSAPDGVVRPLAEAAERLGKVSAHFFSFGGVGATARWAAAAAAGRIVLDRADGFGVEPP
ncbi:MAG TPA: methylenetetrahydrofolate reductase [Xanthobacteraceae bacterium]|nr:methylenetetrahydrofolate reductase [Xanthobacteraceae bacterium]